jgi:hypothetical protein
MKKTVLIFGIFALIVSGCNQIMKGQVETLDVTEGISREQEEDFDSALLGTILKQLHISVKECDYELITQKELPYMKSNSVFVIPQIVYIDEDDTKVFDAYIVIVENETGKIIHHFYEKEAWTSDAIRLDNIEIDTAPYRLNKNTRAFGIRLKYIGSTRPNPYASTEISLFIPRENSLVRILKDYKIYEFGGEWDTNCEGGFSTTESIFIMSNEQTNGFYNIEVKSTITDAVNELIDDDCIEEKTVTQNIQTLRYVNGNYIQ